MPEEFDDNKTEAPTPRRREDARGDGQVVLSPDLTSGVLLMLASLSVWMFGSAWMRGFGNTIAGQIVALRPVEWGIPQTMLSLRWLGAQVVLISGGIVIGAWVVNVAVSVVQTGFGFHTKPVMLNPEKLSFTRGWQNLFSLDGVVKGFVAPLKVLAFVAAAIVFVWYFGSDIALGTRGSLPDTVVLCGKLLPVLLLIFSGIAVLFGGADFLFRWYRHEQKLKMSREEVKQEQKEEQGDQNVKQQMQKSRQEARKRKSLQDVPTASAVITNPTHFAVAIRYESGKLSAPIVVAKGTDHFARQIIALAHEYSVPVMERKPLARALFALTEVGDEIPIELYRAVAEILADVYRRKSAA